jgi:hypothetical protein
MSLTRAMTGDGREEREPPALAGRYSRWWGAVRLLRPKGAAVTRAPGRGLPDEIVVVGAHGGAGATSVRDLLLLADASDQVCERDRRDSVLATPHAPVLLVARTTASGLAAAAQLLADRTPEEVPPHLVLVADAPAPPPLACRYRVTAIGGQVTAVAWVPWLWPLRSVDQVLDAEEARSVRRAAWALRDAVVDRGGIDVPVA